MSVRPLSTMLFAGAALAVAVVGAGCRSGSITGAVASPGAEQYGTLAERGMASRTTSPSLADRLLGFKGDGVPATAPLTESQTAALERRLGEAHDLARQGRTEEARVAYQDVLRRQPTDPVAHHRLGVIGDQQQDYVAAEEHYLAALRTRPTDPDLLSDLGYSYLLQGRFEEAEKQLSKAVKYHARHERAANNLAMLHVRRGEPERALAVLRQAGTEADAQRRLAVLLRDSQDSGSLARTPSPGPGPVVTARNGGPALTPTAAPHDGTVGDLRQTIHRERQKARTERDLARNAGSPVAPDQHHPAVGTHDPNGTHAPAGAYARNPPRIPDERLIDSFDAIDDGPDRRQPPAWPHAPINRPAPIAPHPAFGAPGASVAAEPRIVPYGSTLPDGRPLPPAGTPLVIAPREHLEPQGVPVGHVAPGSAPAADFAAPTPNGRSPHDPNLWPGDGRVAFVPQPMQRPAPTEAPPANGFPPALPHAGAAYGTAPPTGLDAYGAPAGRWDAEAARRAAVMGLGTGPGSLLPWFDSPGGTYPTSAPSMNAPSGGSPQTTPPPYGTGPAMHGANPSFGPALNGPQPGTGPSGAERGPSLGLGPSAAMPPQSMQPPYDRTGYGAGNGIVPAGGMHDGSAQPGREASVAPAGYATPSASGGYVEPPQWPGRVPQGSMTSQSGPPLQTQWPSPGQWSPPAPQFVNPLGQVAQPADPTLYRAADGTAWPATSPALSPRR